MMDLAIEILSRRVWGISKVHPGFEGCVGEVELCNP